VLVIASQHFGAGRCLPWTAVAKFKWCRIGDVPSPWQWPRGDSTCRHLRAGAVWLRNDCRFHAGGRFTYFNAFGLSRRVQFLSAALRRRLKNCLSCTASFANEAQDAQEEHLKAVAVPRVGAVFERTGFTYMGRRWPHDIARWCRTFQGAHGCDGPG